MLQPAGTGGGPGLGIDVTAAEYSGARAGFAGYGSEISMAAFGAFEPEATGVLGIGAQQAGIFGAFPADTTQLESSLLAPCGCRTTFNGDDRYAYLAGTSMAAPQVAATAAMMRVLNPYATVADVIAALEGSASRPAGTGWTAEVGWGILNAGAALDAIRRVDRLAPASRVTRPAEQPAADVHGALERRRPPSGRAGRDRDRLLRGRGAPRPPPGALAPP